MMRTTQLYQAMVNSSSICCRGPRNDVAAQVASLTRPSSVISFASRMTERSSALKQSTVSNARNCWSCSRRTPVQCRVPVMVHLVGRVRLEPHRYHGQLAEHPGERCLFPQRRRHSKHSFGEVWNI